VSKTGWQKLEQVVCRSEYREDERPQKFRLQGCWVAVEQVLKSWLQKGPGEKDPTFRVFDVKSGEAFYRLRVQINGWLWECKKIRLADCEKK